MRERDIQTKIIQWARKQKTIWIVKYPGGIFGTNGTPDLILCVNGMFVGIEVKQTGEKLTELQRIQQQKIRKSGGICERVESLAEAVEICNRILDPVKVDKGVHFQTGQTCPI